MAKAATFNWIQSPRDFDLLLGRHMKRTLAALHALCVNWGLQVQTNARLNAVWQDRTGAARQGLVFAVDAQGFTPVEGKASQAALGQMTAVSVGVAAGQEIAIFLGHTVYYGVYLELANGAAYAIIMPTLEQELPALRKELTHFMGG